MSLQIFPFLWEGDALLICKAMALQRDGGRESERSMQREEGGEHQKEETLNILIPFLARRVHLYLSVWAPREEAEPSTRNWVPPPRGSRHSLLPSWDARNWFIIQCQIQLDDSTVTRGGYVGFRHLPFDKSMFAFLIRYLKGQILKLKLLRNFLYYIL